MKKIILGAFFLLIASFAIAQSGTTNGTALQILKITPEAYAENVQAELVQVCNLRAEQAAEIYKIALRTAKKIHALEEFNKTEGNPDHEMYIKRILQDGNSYIVNLLDKNQVAAYNKKDNLLRRDELIKERQAKANAYEQGKTETERQ